MKSILKTIKFFQQESSYKVLDRQIDCTLIKDCQSWWPRLISQPQKPPWLKIDFDKWRSEETEDDENDRRDVRNDYPDMYDKLHREEFGYKKGGICLFHIKTLIY